MKHNAGFRVLPLYFNRIAAIVIVIQLVDPHIGQARSISTNVHNLIEHPSQGARKDTGDYVIDPAGSWKMECKRD